MNMKPIWQLSKKQIFFRVLALLPITLFLLVRFVIVRPDFEFETSHLIAVWGVIAVHLLLLLITFIKWKKEEKSTNE